MARIRNTPQQNSEDSAKAAGLLYTSDDRPGIRRLGRGPGFRYAGPNGRRVRKQDLARIRALVIPPAWRDVWICIEPRGHLQATGRDARGRKQYRYHAEWRKVRDETKYDRLIGFAETLPVIRRRTAAALATFHLSRQKVLALVVQLLEKTLIRVGNDEYAKDNQSFGLTTMRDTHVEVSAKRVRFSFRGKSGVEHEIDLNDRRLARTVKAVREIPGYELFQFYDEDGKRQGIGSSDVNAYLKEISGEDYTSKDFRTWAGTVLTTQILRQFERYESEAEAKRNILRAVEQVAKRLGNTKAVCRKCYIHPAMLDAYLDGSMLKHVPPARRKRGLSQGEAAVLALLRRRLGRDAKKRSRANQ
jgi:DNA topoisomerase-1